MTQENSEVSIEARLKNIEAMLAILVEKQQGPEWYTTREFAEAVGMAEFSIREHCRRGRLKAEKRQSGRGSHHQWVLSRSEMERYRRHGLLPVRNASAMTEPAA